MKQNLEKKQKVIENDNNEIIVGNYFEKNQTITEKPKNLSRELPLN